MKGFDKKMNQLEKEEKNLMKKEKDLEQTEKKLLDHDSAHKRHIQDIEKRDKRDNWGEGNHEHIIKMAPLVPFGGFGPRHSSSNPARAM